MNQKQKLKVPAIEVSIIIISYNVQKYLIQCIKSILHHTNKKFKYEIIVIDNHSVFCIKLIIQILLYNTTHFSFTSSPPPTFISILHVSLYFKEITQYLR